jgi:hypothetical protein
MFRSKQGVIPGLESQNYDDILKKQKVFSQCSDAAVIQKVPTDNEKVISENHTLRIYDFEQPYPAYI